MNRRSALAFAALTLALPVFEQDSVGTEASNSWPPYYPRSYARIVDQAKRREGTLTIWSSANSRSVAALLDGFRHLYPDISINYVELRTSALYQRSIANAGRDTADILWSSAMDLQIKLVNDGYSQPYASPERSFLPDWAVWKNQAWGITAEPIVFAYNRKLTAAYPKVPDTHADLVRFLRVNSRDLYGKIATYNPGVSGGGYLYFAQDKQAYHNTWELVSAMGGAGVRLYPTSEAILEQLAQGHIAFAYDVVSSYALEASAANPQIGVVVPRDYALIMSRIAMIPEGARHPNAARLFLDYLLSRAGQSYLSAEYMTPVRPDVALPSGLRMETDSARAIRVGPGLLVQQDQLTRGKFLRDWASAIAGDARAQ